MTLEVIHLGQLHRLPFDDLARQDKQRYEQHIEDTIKCQIDIATDIRDRLKADPSIPVFAEGLTADSEAFGVNMTEIDMMMFVSINTFFSKGIPRNFSELGSNYQSIVNDAEGDLEIRKDMLYRLGATRMLKYTGALETIHATISPELDQKISAEVEAGDYRNTKRTREKAAIEAIKSFSDQNPKVKSVILVYGNAHDFTKACELYGFKYTKISHSRNENAANSGDVLSAGSYLKIGEVLKQTGKLESAINAFQKAILFGNDDESDQAVEQINAIEAEMKSQHINFEPKASRMSVSSKSDNRIQTTKPDSFTFSSSNNSMFTSARKSSGTASVGKSNVEPTFEEICGLDPISRAHRNKKNTAREDSSLLHSDNRHRFMLTSVDDIEPGQDYPGGETEYNCEKPCKLPCTIQ